VVAARDAAALAEVAEACRKRGADAIAVPTDVGVEAECRRLIDRAEEAFGRLDVLIPNAGQDMWARLDEITDTSIFERLMRVNYLGPAWLAHRALPALKKAKGRIVVVSSLAGLTGVPTRTGYCATKHALHGFFDALRIELAGTGVTVTIVCPDFVVSEIHKRALGPDGKPLGASPMAETKIMTAAECAARILEAARRRERLTLLTARGHWGRWVRLVAPGLIDRIADRSVARGH
jgi:NAD(P)-dependent dehydrogenase (short-subunit alcohol dehydrogenase family)